MKLDEGVHGPFFLTIKNRKLLKSPNTENIYFFSLICLFIQKKVPDSRDTKGNESKLNSSQLEFTMVTTKTSR